MGADSTQGFPRAGQPLQRWRTAPVVDLRARDHALHHGVDHHQLLTVVIPRFEALKKEGQAGQTKMTQYALPDDRPGDPAEFDAHHLCAEPSQLFGNPNCTQILTDNSVVTILIMVLTMTAGTGLIMWLGELVTDRGVGNGMSILIFTSIAAGFPGSLWAIQQRDGRWDIFFGVILMGF